MGCNQTFGYLTFAPKDKVAEIASFFDRKLGFWQPGVGCSLPRHLRSRSCLKFHCIDDKNSPALQNLVRLFDGLGIKRGTLDTSHELNRKEQVAFVRKQLAQEGRLKINRQLISLTNVLTRP